MDRVVAFLSHWLARLYRQPLGKHEDAEALWVPAVLLAWQAEEDQGHRGLKLEVSSPGGVASPHPASWSFDTISLVLFH